MTEPLLIGVDLIPVVACGSALLLAAGRRTGTTRATDSEPGRIQSLEAEGPGEADSGQVAVPSQERSTSSR